MSLADDASPRHRDDGSESTARLARRYATKADLAARLRSRSLRAATALFAALFAVGSLFGLPQLATDPPAFFVPLSVSVSCGVAWGLARRGRERAARRLFVITMVVDLLSLMLFAPFLLRLTLGFPLSVLTVFLFHLVHRPGMATRIGGVMVAVLAAGFVSQAVVDGAELLDWRIVTSAVAQLLVLAFSTLALGRLGRDWTLALAEADQARNQLLDAHQLATQASRAKSRFLATMSHELRTPLNAVIGYSELAAEEGVAKVEDLERIQAAGHHLLGLVDQILDLSRIESGRIELDPREVSLDDLVGEVCDILRPQVHRRQNRFRLELAPVAPNRLDPLRTRQIVTNLIGNAIKFTENGTIAVTTMEGPGWQRDLVKDDGPGIPHHRLEQIFAPFEQASPDVQVNFGGTGLGLAISRRLAEEMGGRLWVESELGVGSTFILELPSRDLGDRRPDDGASSRS